MARKSRLIRILTLAEDMLLFFDDYFKSTSWVYHDTGVPKIKVQKSAWYLIEKNILNKDLSFKKKPKTVYSEITKPWNKKWRIIIYDIPEEKSEIRDKLSYILAEFGFKRLQRSVWLSPFTHQWIIKKINNFIDNPKYLFTFEAKLSRRDANYLVDELWDVEDWKYTAKNFIAEIKAKGKLTKKDKSNFWNLIAEHPKVPLDLLSNDWPLKKVTKIFTKFNK